MADVYVVEEKNSFYFETCDEGGNIEKVYHYTTIGICPTKKAARRFAAFNGLKSGEYRIRHLEYSTQSEDYSYKRMKELKEFWEDSDYPWAHYFEKANE